MRYFLKLFSGFTENVNACDIMDKRDSSGNSRRKLGWDMDRGQQESLFDCDCWCPF